MKTFISLTFVLFLALSVRAEETSINFGGMPADQVVDYYSQISGHKKLAIASNVLPHLTNKMIKLQGEGPKEAILKLIREKLAAETGLILTEIGDKISVTYNDQLASASDSIHPMKISGPQPRKP